MEIKQSYIMSIARAKLSLYEQRLLVKAVQAGQSKLTSIPIGATRKALPHNGAVEIEIQTKEICQDGQHYDYVLQAAKALTTKNVTYIDEGGSWTTCSWVMRARHQAKTGKIYILMDERFYKCMYDLTKGYSHYDLQRALSYKRATTVRLYILLNSQRRPITYTIEQLKHITGTMGQYAKTNDFIRKVITPAHDEIKQGGGQYWEFTYLKEGTKIKGLTFTPIMRTDDREEQASFKEIKKWLPLDYVKILLQHAGFTTWQLSCHKALLSDLATIPDGLDLLLGVIQRARKARPVNMQGYIINALKAEIKAIGKK